MTLESPEPHDGTPKPPIDIVIVNWNAGQLLRDCIFSIMRSCGPGVDLRSVVVVDNASSDGSADFIDSLPHEMHDLPVTCIRNITNRGFAAACNQGAALGSARYVLFLNPDTQLFEDSLARPLEFLEDPANENVGIVGIQLVDEDGRVMRTCARFPTPAQLFHGMSALDRILPSVFPPHFMTEWRHDEVRDVDQVMGAFFLVRRSLFEALGGFDERYFVYYEEVDFARRALNHGSRTVFVAHARAYHKGAGTTKGIHGRRLYYSLRSRILYVFKHFGPAAGATHVLATLTLEMVSRSMLAAARDGADGVRSTLAGYRLLARNLPDILEIAAERPRDDAPAAARSADDREPLRVLLLTRYGRRGATSRQRFLQYVPHLERSGFYITHRSLLSDDDLQRVYAGEPKRWLSIAKAYLHRIFVLLRSGDFDLLWIERELLPFLPAAVERALMKRRIPYVVDLDDAEFHRFDRHASFAVRMLLGWKFDRLMADASLVIVGNEYLEERARAASAGRVDVLPTTVDLDAYNATLEPDNDRFVIGWIGTPVTAKYLSLIENALRVLSKTHDVELRLIGPGRLKMEGVDVRSIPWSEATEASDIAGFDVGIMPLLDTPWERGKCGYKLIQCMAAGKPVVASPVGINASIVEVGKNGFLANTEEEWLTALRTLAESRSLRREMGRRSRQIVEERFDAAKVVRRLDAALRSAASLSGIQPAPEPLLQEEPSA